MATTLKTLIIEDEQPAIDLLQFYLKDFKEVEVEAVCKDGFEGLKAINEKKPDLVFLDIQMPKLTGFELIELLEHKPMIIFTTAYDDFAIKAFEVNAIDYLLKPFSTDRLKQAIEKVIENKQSPENKTPDYKQLSEYNVAKPNEPLKRVVVKRATKLN
jgi:two-component system LytT family response regulator